MATGWILQALFSALIARASVLPQDGTTTLKTDGSSSSSTTPNASKTDNDNTVRPIVHTSCGDLRGIEEMTKSGDLFDKFLGIPYGLPPVGNLRFSPPKPAARWSGTREAVHFGNQCIQLDMPQYTHNTTDNPIFRSEDCLYLNVYRPVTSQSQPGVGVVDLLPVMFYIHGGGYYLGAGSQYDGSELASRGVIVVTINYRLNLFGFLSNGDDVIPGNYGMLDQLMALEWVRSNIKSFGGDPGRVTIFGQSAGAGSVSLLTLSPLSKGLFQKAILESGSSMCPWAVIPPATGVTSSQKVSLIGSLVGCVDTDAVKKLDCLRKVETTVLFNASQAVKKALGANVFMAPVVEKTYGFLPDHPQRLLVENKFQHVDTIHGFNKDEYGFQILKGQNSYTKQEFIDALTKWFSDFSILDRDAYYQEVFQDYVGNKTDGHNIMMQCVNAISDMMFRGAALVEAKIMATLAPEKSHVVYEFDHKPSTSSQSHWVSAVHGEELSSVFGVDLPLFHKQGKLPSKGDYAVSNQVQTMWTNFAKYGNATKSVPSGAVTWSRYDSGDENVLRIKEQSLIVSFLNHISQRTFQKLNRLLSVSVPDSFVG